MRNPIADLFYRICRAQVCVLQYEIVGDSPDKVKARQGSMVPIQLPGNCIRIMAEEIWALEENFLVPMCTESCDWIFREHWSCSLCHRLGTLCVCALSWSKLLLLCSQGWLLYARALEFLHLGGVTPICGDKQDQNVVGTSYLYAAWFIFCTLKGLILCIDRVSMYKYFMGAMYNVSFHLKYTYLYFDICNLMVV